MTLSIFIILILNCLLASICTATLKRLNKTGFNCSEKLTSKLWKQKEERKKKSKIKSYFTK